MATRKRLHRMATKQKSIHLECLNNHVYSRFMHFLRFIPFYYFTLTNWTILIEKQLEKNVLNLFRRLQGCTTRYYPLL